MILLLIEFVLFVAFVLAIATWVLPALFPSAFKKSKIEKLMKSFRTLKKLLQQLRLRKHELLRWINA